MRLLRSKKGLIAVVALVAALGVGYTMTKSAPASKQKVKGTIYVLPKEFLINLADGRYAKLAVALELAPGQSDGASAAGGSSDSESAAGTLPEEALVREIVTDAVTGQSGETLVGDGGRRAIRDQILQTIRRRTDVKVEAVLFPDVTVQ